MFAKGETVMCFNKADQVWEEGQVAMVDNTISPPAYEVLCRVWICGGYVMHGM